MSLRINLETVSTIEKQGPPSRWKLNDYKHLLCELFIKKDFMFNEMKKHQL